MLKNGIKILLFLLLCTSVFFTQKKVDTFELKKERYYTEKNLFITLPTDMVKYFTLGFDNVIADLLWIQFIQYYGENSQIKRLGGTKYDFSFTYKYIDVITTLDPNFQYAYWLGAFAIADEMERPDLAIKMIEKGIKNNPKNWWLPYTAAVMELMYNNNFVDAYKYIQKAAELKPNNEHIQHLKTVLESKKTKQEKSREVWLEVYKIAQKQGDEMTMEKARKKMKILGYKIEEIKNEQ